jgi:hypothetical protein
MKLVDLVIRTFPVWPSDAGFIVQNRCGWIQAYKECGRRLELIGREPMGGELADETKTFTIKDPSWSCSKSEGGVRISKFKYNMRRLVIYVGNML